MGQRWSDVKEGAAAWAISGAIGGATGGTFAAPGVGTAFGGVIGAITGAIGGGLIGLFFSSNKSSRTLMSDGHKPPISTVLAMHEVDYLLECMASAINSRNLKAIDYVGQKLTDVGLDHITEAFKQGIRDNLLCTTCGEKLTIVDELCYCPGAATNCHHINKCCSYEGQRGMIA